MKTAVVTGSTKGIGLSISRALLQRKYFVIMNYSNDTVNAKAVEQELDKDYSGKFAIIKQNLATEKDVADFYSQYVEITNGGGALTHSFLMQAVLIGHNGRI